MKKKWLIAATAGLALTAGTGIVSAAVDTSSKYVDRDEFRNSVTLTDKPVLTGKYKLKAPDLAPGIKMGVGSSLTHLPGDPDNVFYSTADRGPNGQVDVDGKSRRTFPLPDYTVAKRL